MTSASRLLPRFFLALLCSLVALAARAADDVRFSATLTPAQRELAGLNRLTADNVAVIDGLVRQDLAESKFKDNDVDHTRFSARHTARERELAGLDRLAPAEQKKLDDFVGQRIAGIPSAGENVAAIISGGSAPGVKPDLPLHKLDIHGVATFTSGWGKGGSMTGGDLLLTYEDPAGRYAIAVDYAEYHGKGLAPCYLPGYGYGFYHTLPDPFPESR